MMLSFGAAALLWLSPAQSGDLIPLLENKDPRIRELAARLAGLERLATAVGRLVRMLDDEVAPVREAARASLAEITGRTNLEDAAAWQAWWTREGRSLFPETAPTEQELRRIAGEEVERRSGDYIRRVEAAKQEVRFMAVLMGAAIVLFLGVMIFFVGNVSSKIKGWRELVARAEVYLKQGQEITDRADKILAELDAKKVEVMSFFAKLREENESLVARYADHLRKETEHSIREEVLNLRQRAEKELGQTVDDLKTQLDIEARRVRDRMAQ